MQQICALVALACKKTPQWLSSAKSALWTNTGQDRNVWTNGPESSSKVSPYTGIGPWMALARSSPPFFGGVTDVFMAREHASHHMGASFHKPQGHRSLAQTCL